MKIRGHSTDERVLIVAEIGNNHEGNFDRACALVRSAAECKVDAVKFQTFQARLFTGNADPQRFQRLRSFELSYAQFAALEHLARELGLIFISTPLDLESARFLTDLVDCFKVASGDNDFFPLMDVIARTGKSVIVSSGLTDLEGITVAKRFIEQRWEAPGNRAELGVLHCVSSYPVPPEQANLRAIPGLAAALGCTVGYSDHTLGIEACSAAVALGARILEKHFTLDKHQSEFRDHQLSADPDEMRALVRSVRTIEAMLGSGEKRMQACEAPIVPVARRSITSARELPAGHVLGEEDLLWLRPAGGLRPGQEAKVVGKKLRRGLGFGERIALEDLE